MKKRNILLSTAAALTMAALMTVGVSAKGWIPKEGGWKFARNEEFSSWCQDGWYWIDGNSDGIAECYYFNSEGYMVYATTTPDGYTVNADGAWTVDGVVQTKQVEKGYFSYNLNEAAKVAATNPVTDASTIEKITLKSNIDALFADGWYNHNGMLVDAITDKTYYDTMGNGDPRYTTVIDGVTLYARTNNLVGHAKDFFNNIPEQGILIKAFYDSLGYPGITSQSRDKREYGFTTAIFTPLVPTGAGTGCYMLETLPGNARIFIHAIKGEEVYKNGAFMGDCYVYPDSMAIGYTSYESPHGTKFDTIY